MLKRLAATVVLLGSDGAWADLVYEAPPRTMNFELKFGGYVPMIDSEKSLNGATPYASNFGNGSALLAELEVDRILWQKVGTLGVGASLGYAQKYAHVSVGDAVETISFNILPVRLLGVYRFDWPALKFNEPLVPYGKAGLVYMPWWFTKGSGVEYAQTATGLERAAGAGWGYELVGGMSFMLDVLEPRLARDFYADLGVRHVYLFGEFTFVNSFSRIRLDLSSRHWMFGLSLDY